MGNFSSLLRERWGTLTRPQRAVLFICLVYSVYMQRYRSVGLILYGRTAPRARPPIHVSALTSCASMH